MLNSSKIAVTGSIASGKSTVCRFFEELGATVISADDIVHELLSPITDIGKQIIVLLGADCVVGEAFDREKMAAKVFRDHELLKRLEKVLHPEVQRVIEAKYAQVSKKSSLFVVEVPLLYESQQDPWYDYVIVVTAEENRCKEWYRGTEEAYSRRSKRLMPLAEKMRVADFVIENNGTLDALKTKVIDIFNQLT